MQNCFLEDAEYFRLLAFLPFSLPNQHVNSFYYFKVSFNKAATLVYTVKKVQQFSRPNAAGGCHLPNSPWPGIIKYFPAKESLVCDIPPGDGKIANLFLQCSMQYTVFTVYTHPVTSFVTTVFRFSIYNREIIIQLLFLHVSDVGHVNSFEEFRIKHST